MAARLRHRPQPAEAGRYACRTMRWKRLWQPHRGLFWMMLGFNLLSTGCTWAMRTLPLNTLGLMLVGFIALINVGFGLLAAWQLMREEPPRPG